MHFQLKNKAKCYCFSFTHCDVGWKLRISTCSCNEQTKKYNVKTSVIISFSGKRFDTFICTLIGMIAKHAIFTFDFWYLFVPLPAWINRSKQFNKIEMDWNANKKKNSMSCDDIFQLQTQIHDDDDTSCELNVKNDCFTFHLNGPFNYKLTLKKKKMKYICFCRLI